MNQTHWVIQSTCRPQHRNTSSTRKNIKIESWNSEHMLISMWLAWQSHLEQRTCSFKYLKLTSDLTSFDLRFITRHAQSHVSIHSLMIGTALPWKTGTTFFVPFVLYKLGISPLLLGSSLNFMIFYSFGFGQSFCFALRFGLGFGLSFRFTLCFGLGPALWQSLFFFLLPGLPTPFFRRRTNKLSRFFNQITKTRRGW